MGTTSDKLTYLNETKSQLKDTINLTGASITNDTFRSYPEKLYNEYLDIINNGTEKLYENLPKVNGTGSEIKLDNTDVCKIKINELGGNTEQKSYSGKNKYNINNLVTKDCYYEINNNNIVVTATGTYAYIEQQIDNLNITNQYILFFTGDNASWITILNSSKVQIKEAYSSKEIKFTPSTSTIYVRIYTTTSLSSATKTFAKIQVEEGPTATSYEPYVGGTPSPNPDYPQEVRNVVGVENLFDKDNANIIDCLINGSTNTISSYNGTKTLYIPITGGKTYTVSKKISARFVVGSCVDTPANNVQCTNVTQNNTSNSITLTTGSTDNYLCVFYFLNGTDTLTEEQIRNSIMIEEGSTQHDYVPYGHWVRVKVKGKNIFNGTYIDASVGGNDNNIFSTSTTAKTAIIPCEPSTTYTIKKYESSNRFTIADSSSYPINNQIVNLKYYGTTNLVETTITTSNDANYLLVYVSTSTEQAQPKMQIEENTTATPYQPYQEQTQLLDLNIYDNQGNIIGHNELCKISSYKDYFRKSTGKNLLNLDYTSQTINGVTITVNNDKSITLNGTSTEGISLYSNNAITLKAGTYTHSVNQIQNGLFCSLNNITATMLNGNNSEKVKTFTISEDTTYSRYLIYINSGKTFNNYTLKLQIEENTQATSYEPYGKVWYLHKAIGKVVLDGSEISIRNTYTNIDYAIIPKPNDFLGYNIWDKINIVCDSATYISETVGSWDTSNNINKISGNPTEKYWWLGFTKGTTQETMQTQLNGKSIYYPLATPTDTIITDESVINSLEAIASMLSYEDTTYIVSVDDIPMIMDISAVSKYNLQN